MYCMRVGRNLSELSEAVGNIVKVHSTKDLIHE